jgi:two-component system NtrC family sensor kinase
MERSILVAEDSPTQAERLRLLLEDAGYRVDVVANGREGLERVRVAPPDLIISDVVMPGLDGYGFCQAVKSAELTRRIPFVLLTQQSAPADLIKGLERGADNFIPKPFDDDYLLDRVRRIFENLELRRQGRLDVEIALRVGGREIVINADKQQIFELLFSTLEELTRLNDRLEESQRTVEEHARDLEAKVQERTQQLLQTEKVAAMGALLAGVAHELNNPLAVVMGQAALLLDAAAGGPLAARAEKITKAAERCARIVKNFLALARQHPPERSPVALNRIVQEAVELLAYPLRVAGVEVRLDLATDLPDLWADPHQLHQVVVNLVTNAEQAMRPTAPPHRLTLSTQSNVERTQVCLAVADTGPGIPPEIQSRLFEPFFTTKPPGQGTGLGLALCHGIVDEHKGSIRVESQPGQGAVFRLELPVEPRRTMRREAFAAELRPPVRGKTVLVVDDEREISEMLAEMLAVDGHQVETAVNGALALAKLGERAYDLIFSDLRMPELDGPGLWRELERRDPELQRRVIFLTGDTLSPEISEFLRSTKVPTVSKPFNQEELRRAVHRVLA